MRRRYGVERQRSEEGQYFPLNQVFFAAHGTFPQARPHIVHIQFRHGVEGHIAALRLFPQKLALVFLCILLPGKPALFLELTVSAPISVIERGVPGASLLVFIRRHHSLLPAARAASKK